MQDDLNELLKAIWVDLQNAVADSKNPFRTPTLGSINSANEPSLRTVVLRAVDSEKCILTCYTDIRSAKIEEIRRNPAISFLFYDVERKIQLRASGLATIHHLDEIAKAHWQQTNLANRLAYMTILAPGTVQNQPHSGLKEGLAGRLPTQAESEEGWPNFAVVNCSVGEFDWVLLSSKGNRRATFHLAEQPVKAAWLVP